MKHPKSYDTDAETSIRMSNVKLKHGAAETMLAKALWHEGYRYRLNYRQLPGSPDIAVLKYHVAVFVDGEFWHGYNWDERKGKLKRNRDYWIEKIEENIERDKNNDQRLLTIGWTPIHFWTKEVTSDSVECVKVIKELIIEQRLSLDEDL